MNSRSIEFSSEERSVVRDALVLEVARMKDVLGFPLVQAQPGLAARGEETMHLLKTVIAKLSD